MTGLQMKATSEDDEFLFALKRELHRIENVSEIKSENSEVTFRFDGGLEDLRARIEEAWKEKRGNAPMPAFRVEIIDERLKRFQK